MAENKKRAAIYARYSTEMQREGKSIESQVFRTKKFIDDHGWELASIYKDEAQSGQYTTRRGFRCVVDDARAGKFEIVVIDAITRASRFEDVMDYYAWKRDLNDAGAEVYSATEDIHNEEIGDLIEFISLWQAKHEIHNIRKNVRRTLELNASKGKFNGGIPPLGYDVDKDNEYILNLREAESVKKIFRMYLNGYGYGAIAERLNEEGYVTKRGVTFGKNSIRDILMNPRYTGTYEYGRTPEADKTGKRNHHGSKPEEQIIRIENRLPVIIDKGDYEKVMKKMEAKKRTRSRSVGDLYLLSGVLVCGDCGYAMTGRHAKKGDLYYYECIGKKKHKSPNCKNTSVRCDVIEDAVINYLEAFAQNKDEIFEWFTRALDVVTYETRDKALVLQTRHAQLKKEANALVDKILVLDSPTLRERLKDTEAQIASVELQLTEEADSTQKITEVTPEAIREELDILRELHTYSRDIQKQLIRKYIKKIVVTPDNDPTDPKSKTAYIESRLSEKFDANNVLDSSATLSDAGLPLHCGWRQSWIISWDYCYNPHNF